jgi:hypothetical protein
MTVMTAEATFTPGAASGDPLAELWLRQATLRLRREVSWRWRQRGGANPNPDALPPNDGVSPLQDSLDLARYRDARRAFFETDVTAAYLTAQLDFEPKPAGDPARGSFTWLVNALGLDDVAAFALGLGLLARLDAAAGPVIAACQGEATRMDPSLGLVQRLWDQPEGCLSLASASHPLWCFGLIQSSRERASNDWDAPFTVPPLVAACLLGRGDSSFVHPLAGDGLRLPEAALPLVDRLRAPADGLRVLPLRGRAGTPFRAVAAALAATAARAVCSPVAAFKDGRPELQSLLTLAWLQGVDVLLQPPASELDGWLGQLAATPSVPVTVYVAVTGATVPSALAPDMALPGLALPPLEHRERVARFQRGLGPKARRLGGAVAEAARRFRFEAETIDDVCQGLRIHSGRIGERELFAACRLAAPMAAGELAQPVAPRFRPEELVLPPPQQRQFEEIERAMRSLTTVHYAWNTARAWNESGISVLFAGPSGTGKTMAAEVLATRLDIPMFRINLSQVVNKYIGETEKNLERVFDAADATDTLLFFDEADALFGRRTDVKDAHDRYANLEVSYLLERMERFKGLAVLATNRRGDLDDAFLRRLRYIVEFPLPEAPQRLEIWRRVIPELVDASELDFDFLARFQLAGGNIRSAAFNACLQLAGRQGISVEDRPRLAMDDVVIAVKREYDKLQRTVSLEQFGRYAQLVETVAHG